jgi:hypothetical protein
LHTLFGWLSGVSTQTGSVTNLNLRLFRRFGEASTRDVPRLCIILFPGVYLTTEEKSRKNLSQGTRKVLGLSAPSTIRLVGLATVKRWPRMACWLPSLLAYASGQPLVSVGICRVAELGDSPRQLTSSRVIMQLVAAIYISNTGEEGIILIYKQ